MTTGQDTLVCPLCVAAADATALEESFLHNTPLAESHRFVVIPSIGPFLPGHVMVVSKIHESSLLSMGVNAVQEYDSLAERLRRLPVWDGTVPLEAEHGSTSANRAGACVVHSHVHWIPGTGQYFDILASQLAHLSRTDYEASLAGRRPYIFLRGGSECGFFRAGGLPSQAIRRFLCDVLGRDDTDWRQNPRLDWVAETVKRWTTLETRP